ncbi:hypothetical protein [Vibrio penaeicida]|uniref:hypothetical protein n=1 Tax=Vibrio penaeicida TaxID=104609 RepID=UPI000CE9E70E|nr:hypothetical protein [Vibrio penaeicida]
MRALLLSLMMFNVHVVADELSIPSDVLNCAGSEPDWYLEVTPKKASFELPSTDEFSVNVTQSIETENHTNKWVITAEDNQFHQQIVIALAETHTCSDDMSDKVYQYETILLVHGQEAYSGCCNVIKG